MKYKGILIIVICLLGSAAGPAQVPENPGDALLFWGDIMTHASLSEHRAKAEKEFRDLLYREIRSTPHFGGFVDSIPWLSVQQPPSDSFRLITWQWKDGEGIIRNHGVIQRKNDTTFIVLQDLKRQISRPQSRTLRAPQWIGARYFKMIPFASGPDTAYVLLGYDGYTEKETVQVIEFLSFDKGHPIFGGNFLKDSARDRTLDRRILRYLEGADVKLTYHPDRNRIVFDHLRPIDHPGMPGGGSWIPDGTYEAYQLKGGIWEYDEKVYQRILDRPPVNRPRGRDEERDLFGRPKNGNR